MAFCGRTSNNPEKCVWRSSTNSWGKRHHTFKRTQSKVQAGYHRMTEDKLHWWEDFMKDKQTLRTRWDKRTDERQKEFKEENWCIKKLKTHQWEATPPIPDDSAARQDKELETLPHRERSLISTCKRHKNFINTSSNTCNLGRKEFLGKKNQVDITYILLKAE